MATAWYAVSPGRAKQHRPSWLRRPMSNLDRIITSAPVNRTAASVVGQGGCDEDDVLSRNRFAVHVALPLPIRPPLPCERCNPSFHNLSGHKYGWMTVMGIYDAPTHGMRWVVRCVCGRYETRTARAIRNPLNDRDKCEECYRVDQIRRRERDIREGRYRAKSFTVTERGTYTFQEAKG